MASKAVDAPDACAAAGAANAQHKAKRRGSKKSTQNGDATSAVDDPVEIEVRRRMPPQAPRRPNDVYITLRTHAHAQLKRYVHSFARSVFFHTMCIP